MTRLLTAAALAMATLPAAAAAPWQFSPAQIVAAPARDGVFHHLDSAGRRAIAAGPGAVALVYESNTGGRPEIYLALRRHSSGRFDAPRRLSGGDEAYEPVIIALDSGEFLAAWEEGGGVWARRASATDVGDAMRVAADAAQISLASDGLQVAAVWVQRRQRHTRVQHALLRVDDQRGLKVDTPRTVDRAPPAADQSYPAVALGPAGTVIAWEDRRHGHTVLYYSHAAPGGRFRAPIRLNEQPPQRSAAFGKGSGVARVALCVLDGRRVVAAWLDKRDFTSGYDSYAAYSRDGGRRFGPNLALQDDFAAGISQWHIAVAGNRRGRLAFVWHDERDGHGDVWLTWPTGTGFSDDLAVPDAAGAQRHRSQPVLAMDADGDLHLAWEERDPDGKSSRIVYAHGRRLIAAP